MDHVSSENICHNIEMSKDILVTHRFEVEVSWDLVDKDTLALLLDLKLEVRWCWHC